MDDLLTGIVLALDEAARTARVELLGSEGTAVPARLADSVHTSAAAPGATCVIERLAPGDFLLLATAGSNPATLPDSGASASTNGPPPASFGYTDGVSWQTALSATVSATGPCALWVESWLAFRSSVQSAASVLEARVSVDGAGAGSVFGWGSALANLQQAACAGAVVVVPRTGSWTVRLQVRVKVSGASVACGAGHLRASARAG